MYHVPYVQMNCPAFKRIIRFIIVLCSLNKSNMYESMPVAQYVCGRPSGSHSRLVSHKSIQLGYALEYLFWQSIPVCYTKRTCPRASHQDDHHRSLHTHWDYKALCSGTIIHVYNYSWLMNYSGWYGYLNI
jgi:hypothetical protein